jgi:hypothetical protein
LASVARGPGSQSAPDAALVEVTAIGEIVEFIAVGTPRALSEAIEAFARTRGAVSALVVPWESDEVTLSMAITLVKTDGWAIDHTNLGTVRLTDLGQNCTGVVVVSHESTQPEQERLAALVDGFGRDLAGRFGATAQGADHPS